MPKTLTALLAAGLLLVAACGDSDDGEDDAQGNDASSTTLPEQTGPYAEFCQSIMQSTGGPPTDVDAPEEIAEDWAILMEAFQAGEDLDSSDPADQQRMQELQERAAPAQQRVTQFITENCNLPGESELPEGSGAEGSAPEASAPTESAPTSAAG